MFRLFDVRGLQRGAHFDQEVETELRYLRSAFPEDPSGAAQERLTRRAHGSSEWRVIKAAIERIRKDK